MRTNNCGFVNLESSDFASPTALRDVAYAADTKFRTQEEQIDYLERPEAIVLTPSAPQVYAGTNALLQFDTITYSSRPGATFAFGIYFSGDWRPGIYLGGVNAFFGVTPPIDSIILTLSISDPRGPRLLNTFTQSVTNNSGESDMLAERITVSMLFEVHTPIGAYLNANVTTTNSGSISLQTTSRLWAYRIRGLSDA